MWRRRLLCAFGLSCIPGLLATWLSAGPLGVGAPQLKLSIRKLSSDSLFGGMAQAVSRGKKWAVVDGVAGKEYQEIAPGTPVFSPDSAHVAYGAQAGGKWLLVVDGVEATGADFEEGFFHMKGHTLVFDSSTQLHAVASGAGGFVRVDVEIGTPPGAPSPPR